MKPDCFKCEYRRPLPGDAHSSCHHPAFKDAFNNPMVDLLALMASVGRVPPMQGVGDIRVVGNPHGVRSGWFNHPWNFDPVWLDECNGFKEKQDPASP